MSEKQEKQEKHEKKPKAEHQAEKETAAKEPTEKKAKPEKSQEKQQKGGKQQKSEKKAALEKRTTSLSSLKAPWKEKYLTECFPELLKKYGYKSKMQVPQLKKIVLNMSLKDAVADSKILDSVVDDFSAISGQKAVITHAKKSIANFKLRKGIPIGVRVTLRGKLMFEFMNRLVNIALPRVRDFKGISATGFDGRGNYTLGLTEQTIFPEIDFDKAARIYGMNISFVTSARTNDEGKELLTLLGMPFRKAGS